MNFSLGITSMEDKTLELEIPDSLNSNISLIIRTSNTIEVFCYYNIPLKLLEFQHYHPPFDNSQE